MRQHLALEIFLDALLERHGLGVAQICVRLGPAVAIQTDDGIFVTLTQGGNHGFEFRRAQMHVTLAVKFTEFNQEILAVHEQLSIGGLAESAE